MSCSRRRPPSPLYGSHETRTRGRQPMLRSTSRFEILRSLSSSPNVKDQARGPSEDGVSDADESPDNGRLPALRCGGWFGSSFNERMHHKPRASTSNNPTPI